MDLDLRGKVAAVTGATGDIGGATARLLSKEGCRVVVSGRNQDTLDELVEEINHAQGDRSSIACRVDLNDEGAGDILAEAATNGLGGLDILVNCAGGGRSSQLLEASKATMPLQTKYFGYLKTIQAAVPIMRARSGGVIANVAGVGGIEPFEGFLPGGVANAAVLVATKVLGRSLGPDGIRVVAVSPGLVGRSSTIPGENDSFVSSIPLQRLASSSDVARAIAFLVSPMASYITATNVVIDGGQTRAV